MAELPQWEYTSVNIGPGESWYDALRLQGLARREAWHIEKNAEGWREIYFKRPKMDFYDLRSWSVSSSATEE